MRVINNVEVALYVDIGSGRYSFVSSVDSNQSIMYYVDDDAEGASAVIVVVATVVLALSFRLFSFSAFSFLALAAAAAFCFLVAAATLSRSALSLSALVPPSLPPFFLFPPALEEAEEAVEEEPAAEGC